MNPRTVCLDSGHGGEDPGGRSLGTAEKLLVMPYAAKVGRTLSDAGYRVVYTRPLDIYVALESRARLANEAGADLFLSFHANSADSTASRGPWSIYAKGSAMGQMYAEQIQATLARVLGGNPKAVYPDKSDWVSGRRLAVLRQTKMPAVLLELGFMTNPSDLEMIAHVAMQERLSAALACTVASLF